MMGEKHGSNQAQLERLDGLLGFCDIPRRSSQLLFACLRNFKLLQIPTSKQRESTGKKLKSTIS